MEMQVPGEEQAAEIKKVAQQDEQNPIADLAGRLWQEMRNVAQDAATGGALGVGIGAGLRAAMRPQGQDAAIAGAIGAGIGAGLRAVLGGQAVPPVEHVPHNTLNGKVQLQTGHILTRGGGEINLGTGQFAQNPPVGWLMRFDKTGLIQADGVKKIDANTYKANDGSVIVIDNQGPLKVTQGNKITTLHPVPVPAFGLKKWLPNLQINQ